jgi:very-short-patch-repair endonuclease
MRSELPSSPRSRGEGARRADEGRRCACSNSTKTRRSRQLRAVENDAESKLWWELRDRRLNGHKFVRQLPVGPYFADFACRARNLVVEVDGSQHAGSKCDQNRDATMNLNGWSVLRFWNIDVLQSRRQVCDTIAAALDGRLNERIIAVDLKYLPAVAGIDVQDSSRPSSARRAPSPRERGEGRD